MIWRAIQRDKQKRTMGDIRTISTAVEAYSVDANHYPSTMRLDDLPRLLEATYIKVLPRNDAWGRPIEYRSIHGQDYTIRSAGKDGKWEYQDSADYPPRYWGWMERDFNCDIVFSVGGDVNWESYF